MGDKKRPTAQRDGRTRTCTYLYDIWTVRQMRGPRKMDNDTQATSAFLQIVSRLDRQALCDFTTFSCDTRVTQPLKSAVLMQRAQSCVIDYCYTDTQTFFARNLFIMRRMNRLTSLRAQSFTDTQLSGRGCNCYNICYKIPLGYHAGKAKKVPYTNSLTRSQCTS